MASPTSSNTPPSSSPSITIEFKPSDSKAPSTTEPQQPQTVLEKLAARSRFTQLAAQLRLRLSYATYKTQNELTHVPFATLEKRVEERHPRPDFTLPDPIAGTKRTLTDSERMPPPPAPSNYFAYSGERPAKRQKTEALAHAGGPSPARFSQFSSPSKRVSHKTPTKRNGDKHSPSKSRSGKSRAKTAPNPRDILAIAMADKEEVNAAKTLASLLVARTSPKPSEELRPLTRSSSADSTTSGMAGPSINVSGSQPAPPGSPSDADRNSAELLLLLATSPSPVRAPSTRKHNLSASGVEPRALFQDAKASPSTSSTTSKPSMLLPAPPSPMRRTPSDASYSSSVEKGKKGKTSSKGNAFLQAPFTPGGLFPNTPVPNFNMADFVHFSPTPGAVIPTPSGGGRPAFMTVASPSGALLRPAMMVPLPRRARTQEEGNATGNSERKETTKNTNLPTLAPPALVEPTNLPPQITT